MCSPVPRTAFREQNTQSTGHFEVSSIQAILGKGSGRPALPPLSGAICISGSIGQTHSKPSLRSRGVDAVERRAFRTYSRGKRDHVQILSVFDVNRKQKGSGRGPFCHGCKSEKPDALLRLLRE